MRVTDGETKPNRIKYHILARKQAILDDTTLPKSR